MFVEDLKLQSLLFIKTSSTAAALLVKYRLKIGKITAVWWYFDYMIEVLILKISFLKIHYNPLNVSSDKSSGATLTWASRMASLTSN